MRKFMATLIIILLITGNLTHGSRVYADRQEWLDTSDVGKGIIHVQYDVKSLVRTKVQIAKGQEKYTYNLVPGKKSEVFPLQMGNGEYSITLLEQTSGKLYQILEQKKVNLKLSNSSRVYLNSIQNVDWTTTKQAAAKARELTKGKKTDTDKVRAIYNYIITTVNYDKQLAANLPSDGYLPEMDVTMASRKAICYGYSSLFAGMVRSVGIPAKLNMGTSAYVDTYHAWNEVYLDGKWITIDTTVDATWKKSKTNITMIKDSSKYQVEKAY
ncbi:transglutaminase-like domain-containing protein [Paenibacillus amylolyticus]|nr:transglutaminase-like domain-containing protein [Paenibacillus amylolyticus]WFR62762.1 transglutaminase-like domain-containing protein [Paenibacillus amylolyticus]